MKSDYGSILLFYPGSDTDSFSILSWGGQDRGDENQTMQYSGAHMELQ